jgi:hypothetical protein
MKMAKSAFNGLSGSHDSPKRPKPASHFNAKHRFVIKRMTIILTEAVEVRCDGQKDRTFS